LLPETLALADFLLPTSRLDTDYNRRLDAMVKENGFADHVELTGLVDRADPLDLYRWHSIHVFPSVREEPMASGLVVISSGTGGSTELFLDGESGLVFKSEDSQDLSGKLEMLLGNLLFASNMGLNSLNRCRQQYRFSNTLAALQMHL
jgi:glycosyltransferase involved in cell wall biosynthesis